MILIHMVGSPGTGKTYTVGKMYLHMFKGGSADAIIRGDCAVHQQAPFVPNSRRPRSHGGQARSANDKVVPTRYALGCCTFD